MESYVTAEKQACRDIDIYDYRQVVECYRVLAEVNSALKQWKMSLFAYKKGFDISNRHLGANHALTK